MWTRATGGRHKFLEPGEVKEQFEQGGFRHVVVYPASRGYCAVATKHGLRR